MLSTLCIIGKLDHASHSKCLGQTKTSCSVPLLDSWVNYRSKFYRCPVSKTIDLQTVRWHIFSLVVPDTHTSEKILYQNKKLCLILVNKINLSTIFSETEYTS